jgi:hypothetical protein
MSEDGPVTYTYTFHPEARGRSTFVVLTRGGPEAQTVIAEVIAGDYDAALLAAKEKLK